MGRHNRKPKDPKPEPPSFFKNSQEEKKAEAAKESDVRWHGLTRGEWTLAVIAVLFGLGAFFVPEVRKAFGRPPENPASEYRPIPPDEAFKKTEPATTPKPDDSKPNGDSAKFRMIPENPKTIVKRTPVRQAQNSFDYHLSAPHSVGPMRGAGSTAKVTVLGSNGSSSASVNAAPPFDPSPRTYVSEVEAIKHFIINPDVSSIDKHPNALTPALPSRPAIIVHIVIRADGTTSVLRTESPSEELSQRAVADIEKWRFRPFMKDGKPIEVITTVRYFNRR